MPRTLARGNGFAVTGGYLVEGYGLSETSPVLMANPVAPNRRVGTVGLPLPSTEARVVDPDRPTDLADALHRLIKDPGLAQELGEQGRRTIATGFDAATTAAQMASLLTGGETAR